LRDEDETCDREDYSCRTHEYTSNLPEIHEIVARWRAILSEYENGEDPKVLITDADTTDLEVIKYYGTFGRVTESLPNNYLLRDTSVEDTPLTERIKNFTSMLPTDATASWLLGSQDRQRLGTDDDDNDALLKALTVLQMTLPGIPVVYYGDEVGMRNGALPSHSPDPYRTPMQWNNDTNAGFSDGVPWTAVNDKFTERNTENTASGTVNAVFRQLSELRAQQDSFQIGNFDLIDVEDESVIAFVREIEGHDRFFVAVNLKAEDWGAYNVANKRDIIPNRPDVVMTTAEDSELSPGDRGDLTKLKLKAYESAIFVWEYSR